MITVNISDHWSDGKRIHVVGFLVPSGNYVTGGDTVNFGLNPIKSQSPPVWFNANGNASYDFSTVLGTTINNSKIKFITGSTALEVAAGAYPAALLADLIQFHAIFPKFI